IRPLWKRVIEDASVGAVYTILGRRMALSWLWMGYGGLMLAACVVVIIWRILWSEAWKRAAIHNASRVTPRIGCEPTVWQIVSLIVFDGFLLVAWGASVYLQMPELSRS